MRPVLRSAVDIAPAHERERPDHGQAHETEQAAGRGNVGGAALDVYSHGAPQGPLAAFSNVIFTPHLGGTTEEALRRVAVGAAGHVVTALNGGVPETVVTPVPGGVRKASA